MLVTLSWSNGHVTGSEGLAWLLKRLWNLRKAMRLAVTEDPCIRHMLPGRVRVYVPGWAGKGKRTIETGLRLIEGVRGVQANPLTGTVLIEYDPTVTDVQIILHEVRALDLETINALDKEPPPPPTQMEKRGRIARARIAVRGLDHNPDLAKLVDKYKDRGFAVLTVHDNSAVHNFHIYGTDPGCRISARLLSPSITRGPGRLIRSLSTK